MKLKTTVLLFLLVCLLAGLIWYSEQVRKVNLTRQQRAGYLFDRPADKAVALKIEKDDFRIELTKGRDGWLIDYPIRGRADGGKLQRILSFLDEMRRIETITAEQRAVRQLGLHDYGLEQPRARLSVFDGIERREVLLGADAPLGKMMYVGYTDDDAVIATTGGIIEALPASVEDIRDRHILPPGAAFRTSRLAVQHQDEGFIQLVNTGDGWRIQQPLEDRADDVKVSALLDKIYSLKIEDFIWDSEAGSEDAENAVVEVQTDGETRLVPYGLTENDAALRLSLWSSDDSVGREIIFGKRAPDREGLIYVKERDVDSVYAVNEAVLDFIPVSVDDFRTRDIFRLIDFDVRYICLQSGENKLVLAWAPDCGWQIVEPLECKADERIVKSLMAELAAWSIESFVDKRPDQLSRLDLDPPAWSVTIADSNPSQHESAREVSLLVGSLDKEDGRLFAGFKDRDFIFKIGSACRDALGEQMVDPLVYRDRTILSITPHDIKQITVKTGEIRQAVVRENGSGWKVMDSETNRANQAAIDNVLFLVSNLRAEDIEGRDVSRLRDYGLSEPSTVITLSLRGEAGIQKKLLIGSPADTGTSFAMVQGQDVIFTLDQSVVKLLSADLCVPLQPQPVP